MAAGEGTNGSGTVTNRQLFDALTEIHGEIAALRVQVASLPCEGRKVRVDSIERDVNRTRDDVEKLKNESRLVGAAASLLAMIAAALGLGKP